MTDCGGTCIYVARKEDPSNWHGKKPDNWVLDMDQPVGLEEKTWDCPHDALSDREYCAFHTHPDDLPAEIDEGELFVKAINESSVSDGEVARRKKEFVGATFGPFNIEGATLDAGDDHSIRLDHATFTSGICADRAVFEHGIFARVVNFETSEQNVSDEINGGITFFAAEFNGDGDLRFDFTEFNGDGDLRFDFTEFNGDSDLRFDSAEFNGDGRLSFSDAEFNGDGKLSFSKAKFSSDNNLLFSKVKFSSDRGVMFDGANFIGDGDLWFHDAKFSGASLSFYDAKFSGDGSLSFYDAEFGSNGDFWFFNAEFSGDGHISFEHAEIGRPCYFGNTRFKSAKQITFSGANIRKPLIFGPEEKGVREVRENFDFSDAVISGELRFRSSGQSSAQQSSEDRNDDLARFSVVFTEAADFSGATFEEPADFSSIQFLARADFRHATFEEPADFSSIQFLARADFRHATFEQPADFSSTQFCAEADFRHARVQNTDFQNADLVGPENASLAAFNKADLSGVNFSNANVTGASFERAVLNRAELLGANLTRTKLYGALLGDARFNRETKFWLSPDASDRVPDDSLLPVRVLRGIKAKLRRVSRRDGSEPYCVYDPRYRGANGETNLEKAAEVYGSLEMLAHQQSQPELASDCFLGRKDIQLKQYRKDRNWLMIARSMVPNVVARYGESPLRVLGTAAATISVCGLAYYSFSLIEHTGTEEPATLFESFYFSALTFTTLGYGDFNPITAGGQMLAVAETSMGVILLAILVFVFGRRATR